MGKELVLPSIHLFVLSFSVGCLKPQGWSPNCLIQSGDSRSSGWTLRRNEDIFVMMHRLFVKMHLAPSSGFLLLVSLMAFCTSGALLEGRDGNGTQNGTAAGGGFLPLALTNVNQIIAREGSCVLINCNVTGEPFPSFQWFNSHGERLDMESEGETDCSCYFKPLFCSRVHQHCTAKLKWQQKQKWVRLFDINGAFQVVRVHNLYVIPGKSCMVKCWNLARRWLVPLWPLTQVGWILSEWNLRRERQSGFCSWKNTDSVLYQCWLKLHWEKYFEVLFTNDFLPGQARPGQAHTLWVQQQEFGAGFDVLRDSTCRDPQEHEWHVRRKQRKPSDILNNAENLVQNS